jgi:putative flippase GtrA
MTLDYLITAIRTKFAFLLRYGTVGLFGAVLQTGVLYVWVSLLGFEETYLLGAVLGFVIALIVSFLLQKFWTFRDRTFTNTHRQLFLYTLVAILNVVLNVALLALAKSLLEHIGVDFFAGWYVLAQIVIVCFASGTSFILNFFFTFRRTVLARDTLPQGERLS